MISNVALKTISSSRGLTELTHQPNDKNVFIFDFDRTLTNGLNLNEESALHERIRGGKTTVELLRQLKQTSTLYVVTARSDLKALLSSFDHAQAELKDILLEEGNLEDVIYKDAKFQVHNKILSTGYNKELGVQFILEKELLDENDKDIHVWFIDDYVANAFNVYTHFMNLKEEGKELAALDAGVNLCCVFWDPYEEESNGSMKASNPYLEEFNFSENNAVCCRAFGISDQEREKRSREYYAKFSPPIKEAKREPKKLDATGSLKLNATLGNIFAARKN
eukprot:augustus_masked-scaffold_10-processed-gene-10.56-mRNA-1 protein AED:1.00 eAED:1.00 QI:0/-1/0/0/-1/1/1/0/278